MNTLVTICARGGSKGVKNKNIRPLLGKPLIAYSIEQAKRWGRADQIVVSTDSEDIARVAREYGALTPFMRPSELATDTAAKIPVISHALTASEAFFGKTYDLVVDLDASAPIRSETDLEMCYQIFLNKKPRLVFSAVPARRNPYFNMVEVTGEGYAQLCKTLPSRVTRRQDAPAVYDMNASIYFYARETLVGENITERFFERSVVHVMHDLSAHDIDSEVDFTFIEYLVKEGLVKL